MTKLKTFADGELLSASHLNTLLQVDVPPGVNSLLNEGVIIPLTGGTGVTLWDSADPIVATRNGLLVEITADLKITTALAAGASPRTMFNNVPVEFRPRRYVIGGSLAAGGQSNAILANSNGVVQVQGGAASLPVDSRLRFSLLFLARSA